MRFVERFMQGTRKITLGPRGPLLHRGVVVVLQSEQTLAAAAALLLLLLLLLLWSDELIWKMPFCWLFCNFFIILTGLFVAVNFGSTIFCINLIFEDIHCTGPLAFVQLPIWSSSWSSLWYKDNLSGFLLFFSTVLDWKEGNGNAWGISLDDPMSWSSIKIKRSKLELDQKRLMRENNSNKNVITNYNF